MDVNEAREIHSDSGIWKSVVSACLFGKYVEFYIVGLRRYYRVGEDNGQQPQSALRRRKVLKVTDPRFDTTRLWEGDEKAISEVLLTGRRTSAQCRNFYRAPALPPPPHTYLQTAANTRVRLSVDRRL
ncbi:hypothetical protein EVAR_80477_1 [Eumeta japonica]|uniref:Uncharacterized protein n=1 Tax=Eumeta variegata TaxID=151549 RepID=A0A4C1YJX3_EUMVA|nr:hypothetical protein EVAR_80477_1 [Eumeta japonica]